MKPRKEIKLMFCPACGRDDGIQRFCGSHFAFGKRCNGNPVILTYILKSKPKKKSA